jgi:hypothetical protein
LSFQNLADNFAAGFDHQISAVDFDFQNSPVDSDFRNFGVGGRESQTCASVLDPQKALEAGFLALEELWTVRTQPEAVYYSV